MTDGTGSGEQLLGTLEAAGDMGVVRMELSVDAGADDVWAALTDPGRLAQWLGEVEGDLRLGGELRARFHASGWEGTGRVEVCEPAQRLRVRTRAPDQAGESTLEVVLTADGPGTSVVWEERGMPTSLVAAYGAGIQIHVEDLGDHLAGRGRRDATARFDPLFAAYQALAPGTD